jgi:2-succinyl-5-enolpyruvyl-6-hydroxy-3-cyclohexene-1-carboxylate synthase
MLYHFRQGIKNIPEICAIHGVRKVVIAPGSRNAPLIFAFTAQTGIECLSITDERSAAYFALGISQNSGEPVALICTSGTAVLNFAPAIAEAYYQNLPLLVFTADRPAEMIDQADGQTLRQADIYANYIKASFNLPVETVQSADLGFSDRQVSQAIDTALSFPQGPVQINVPLREPIYSALPETHSHPKIIKTVQSRISLQPESLGALQNAWTKFNKKIVVFGILPKNDSLIELANRLAKEPDVVVIAENLSNISGERIITQPESLFSVINSAHQNNIQVTQFQPDLLITIGHSVICKQLKLFLREFQPEEQWQFESTMPYVDTYKSLTTVIPGSAEEVLMQMPLNKKGKGFAEIFQNWMQKLMLQHETFVNHPELSDMSLTTQLLKQLPSNSVLHLANSTSVRWTQLYPSRSDLTYYCNRGTSGIDGSMSTAAGFAFASQKPTIFLTGDLSFIYDSNALWNNYIGSNLKIIVLNNNGGNIFRFIGNEQLMKGNLDFFTTPHHVKIKALVEAYGLGYLACNEVEKITECIQNLLASDKATVLEVFTDSDLNTKNYKGYFKHIKEMANFITL